MNINFSDTSSIKNSYFDIYDGMVVVKHSLSYGDVCKYLDDNKHNLFGKYVRMKILNKWWDAKYFFKYEIN